MGHALPPRFEIAAFFVLILAVSLGGCGKPAGKHRVTWEFEGDDVRVIEKFVGEEGERRQFFVAASLKNIDTTGHMVTVKTKDGTFRVYCFDERQAAQLAAVLEIAMKNAES